jgi:tryptophan 2-monooxygenase
MSFIASRQSPPLTTGAKAAVSTAAPATYVDILYDHAGYLRANQSLAPGSLAGQSVAIVGAGAAGLIAAYQLMQLGCEVQIFEATDRPGGRLDTVYPIPGEAAAFEMGAMRVPPCEQLFSYYAGLFGLQPGGQFPDPGKVQTQVIYRNQHYPWSPTQPLPALFDAVNTGWDALATKLSAISPYLTTPTPENFATARSMWQKLIYDLSNPLGPEQGYSGISFYQALMQAFVENYQDYGLARPWNANDFELFGALGVGSGGFGPLYSINFAEIARLIINGLESDQQFYPSGMEKLVTGFVDACPDTNRPGVTVGSCIRYNSKVTAVYKHATHPLSASLTVNSISSSFRAIIVATTNRSMQVDMNITDPRFNVLPQPVSSAVRQLHLMNSSKLFVLTKSKFWQTPGSMLPSNIQSDTLVRGLYCLDYYNNQPGYGVVLISYTWGDDSTKLLAITDPAERTEMLLRSLEHAVPEFVQTLREQILPQYTQMIDWQTQAHYYGAFKLNQPGQDQYNQWLYGQFLLGGPIYLAGDSIGWCGGWIESALQTGMNAASAVCAQILGVSGLYANSPMTQDPNLFQYGPVLTRAE